MPMTMPARQRRNSASSVHRALRWAALAALAAGLYLLAAGAVLAFALDRLLGVGPLRTAFAPDPRVTDPFDLAYAGDPQQAFGKAFETIAVPTDLGPAPAWWLPVADPANPRVAALYVHGIAGRRENGYRQLAAFHDAHVPLLMISYRNDAGAPASPDGRYNFGLDEWRDVDAAVTWLVARGYTRVLLAGESMGGGITGQFLKNSPQARRVTALALDAPALDFRHVVRSLAAARHLPASDAVAATAIGLIDAVRGTRLADARVTTTVAAFPGPVFVAHGTGDALVPVAMSDTMLAQRQGMTRYLRTRAEHLKSRALSS
jgi:pimeloyl-ACP methyl ester carboxylesterase